MELPKKEFKFKLKESSTNCIPALASDLMNAATSLHKLHLKITGQGSFAAHTSLAGYDKFHDFTDQLVEQYQGATGKLLSIPDKTPKTLNTTKEAISFLQELKGQITYAQKEITFSEIINELDTYKAHINSMLYKLTFLS